MKAAMRTIRPRGRRRLAALAATLALLAAGLAWWSWSADAAETQRQAEQARAEAAAAAGAGPAGGLRDLFMAVDQPLPPRAAASGAGSQDPWQLASMAGVAGRGGAAAEAGGTSAGEPPTGLSEEDKAVNEQLAALGYQIAERYYRMPLSELRQAAARKDVQGLTHLAERYLFALDGKPQEAEHEAGFPYREAARNALTEAYLHGNRHAAAMISEAYLLERKPLDAAAWNLVARRAGDELSADWFLKTQDYQQLSEASRQEAQRRADALWEQLEAKKKMNS